MHSLGKQAAFLFVLLLITACGAPLASPPGPSEAQLPPAASAGGVSPLPPAATAAVKIASPLRSVLQRLREGGVTAENVSAHHAESYATPLVRIDQTGSIRVAILVVEVDDEVESLLEQQHQVRIEITDAASRTIQAWVPFDRLESVAALSFVRFIRPPSYAVRR